MKKNGSKSYTPYIINTFYGYAVKESLGLVRIF